MNRLPLRRIAAFATLPAIAAFTPLLVIPSLTATLGAHGWASMAIGQAVGTFGMTVVAFGWATTGPSELPKLAEPDRVLRYRTSVVSRLLVALIVIPAAAAAAAVLVSDEFRWPAALTAVAFACWGLGPTWYFIGTNRPRRIAAFDTLPKLVAALATVTWLEVSSTAYAYPCAYLIAGLGSSTVAAWQIGGRGPWGKVPGVFSHLKSNLSITSARVVGSSFTTLSVPLVSIVSPAAVPAFAAVERMRGFAWMGVNAISAALQAWVFEDSRTGTIRRRQHRALGITVAAGICAGLVLAVGLPLSDTVLFSGEISISPELAAASGATMAVVAASISLTYHVLGPAGAGRVILAASAAGAGLGAPATLLLASSYGAFGAAIGVLLSELVVVTMLGLGARKNAELVERSPERGPTDLDNLEGVSMDDAGHPQERTSS